MKKNLLRYSAMQPSHFYFGYPKVPLKTMINMLAEWVKAGGKTADKPTHFQEREGKY